MAKLRLGVEFEYDPDLMFGDDPEGKRWFFEKILRDPDGLPLHSNEIGDTIGIVRVLHVESAEP